MNKHVKSGKEVVGEFIEELTVMEGTKKEIRDLIKNLYDTNMLTETNLRNGLIYLRKTENEQNQ